MALAALRKKTKGIRGLFFPLLCRCAYALVWCLYRTYRFREFDVENRQAASAGHPHGAYALAVWHEYAIACTLSQVGRPYSPVAGHSKAGKLMGYICERFGFNTCYGAQRRDGQDRGGVAVRQQLLDALQQGFSAALTVDGSRGPRRVVKPGVVDLSRKSGCAILPSAAVAQRYWQLNTWDRFKIPKPFSKIVVCYAPPLHVPENVGSEQFLHYQKQVAEAINACERRAVNLLQAAPVDASASPDYQNSASVRSA